MNGLEKIAYTDSIIWLDDVGAKEHIMSDAEYLIMGEFISNFSKNKKILEIGFGLGISANLIQSKSKPIHHTIVEVHPEVFKKASEWSSLRKNTNVLFGDWLNVVPKLTHSYDIVFYDAHRDKNITKFLDIVKPKLNQKYAEVWFFYYPKSDFRVTQIPIHSKLLGKSFEYPIFGDFNGRINSIMLDSKNILSSFNFLYKSTLLNGEWKSNKKII